MCSNRTYIAQGNEMLVNYYTHEMSSIQTQKAKNVEKSGKMTILSIISSGSHIITIVNISIFLIRLIYRLVLMYLGESDEAYEIEKRINFRNCCSITHDKHCTWGHRTNKHIDTTTKYNYNLLSID